MKRYSPRKLKFRRLARHHARMENLRGAILPIVLILSIGMMMMAAGLAGWASQQARQNARYDVYKSEYNAAEYALNKAYAQIHFMVKYGYGVSSSVFAIDGNDDEFNTAVTGINAPSMDGFDYPTFSVSRTYSGMETQTAGNFVGLTLPVMRYQINVTAKKNAGYANRFGHPGVSLSQTLEIDYVPLYCYAIFYNPLMEIAPGGNMTVGGRVHCNGDGYFQTGATLTFSQNVTLAGSFYHGRAPNSGQSDASGTVNFTKNGSLVSMARASGGNNDGWLDSRDSDWLTMATSSFGSGVKDSAMGVSSISVPVQTEDPHDIIEPKSSTDTDTDREQKLAYKAGLTINVSSSGTISATNADGNAVSLTYQSGGTTYSAASVSKFYDAREGKFVSTVVIDVGKLSASGAAPSNGIVYVDNEYAPTMDDGSATLSAVELTNGADLPAGSASATSSGGFTVATPDPVYIQGNYNTTDKTLAAVAADAVTVLSSSWPSDSSSTSTSSSSTSTSTSGSGSNKTTTKTVTSTTVQTYGTYTKTVVTTTVTKTNSSGTVLSTTSSTGTPTYAATSYSTRNASNTTVNAVCMNGIVKTANSAYSGGVENYFRLLENWSGKTLTFNGSLICMWYSQMATGKWNGNVYSIPTRNWSWDSTVASGPPGLPYGISLTRKSWSSTGA